MDAASFDEPLRAGRAGYAALTGVPVESETSVGKPEKHKRRIESRNSS
jgi:hypothetical protein